MKNVCDVSSIEVTATHAAPLFINRLGTLRHKTWLLSVSSHPGWHYSSQGHPHQGSSLSSRGSHWAVHKGFVSQSFPPDRARRMCNILLSVPYKVPGSPDGCSPCSTQSAEEEVFRCMRRWIRLSLSRYSIIDSRTTMKHTRNR